MWYQLAVLFFALLVGAQEMKAEGFWKKVGGVLAASAPRVESPLMRQMGIDHHSMVVMNGTPFYGRVVVYGKEVAQLDPGDVAYDNRHFEPLNPQIPIAVLFYRDPGRKTYLGAAGQVFSIAGGYPESISWTIREYDIRTPDGQSLYGAGGYVSPYPQPDTKAGTRRVRFPREWWDATAGVQIVNNTFFTLHIRLNGNARCAIGPTEVYYLAAREIYGGYGQQMTLQVVVTDRGRLVGTYDSSFSVPPRGIYAYQAIIGPYDIRR